jgi:hypothetical protein
MKEIVAKSEEWDSLPTLTEDQIAEMRPGDELILPMYARKYVVALMPTNTRMELEANKRTPLFTILGHGKDIANMFAHYHAGPNGEKMTTYWRD